MNAGFLRSTTLGHGKSEKTIRSTKNNGENDNGSNLVTMNSEGINDSIPENLVGVNLSKRDHWLKVTFGQREFHKIHKRISSIRPEFLML